MEKSSNHRVCSECGLIHENGISWHGRCYKCTGELVPFYYDENKHVATTPAGILIYNANS